jgi:hypothetical protein
VRVHYRRVRDSFPWVAHCSMDHVPDFCFVAGSTTILLHFLLVQIQALGHHRS